MIEEQLSPEVFERGCQKVSGAENKWKENNEIVSRFLSKTCVTETALNKAFSLHDHCRLERGLIVTQITG